MQRQGWRVLGGADLRGAHPATARSAALSAPLAPAPPPLLRTLLPLQPLPLLPPAAPLLLASSVCTAVAALLQ